MHILSSALENYSKCSAFSRPRMIFQDWNSVPPGEVVDASLGFIYQAEVPLTVFQSQESTSNVRSQRMRVRQRDKTSAKAQVRSKKRSGGGQTLRLNQIISVLPPLEGAEAIHAAPSQFPFISPLLEKGVRDYICLSWSRLGLLCQEHPVTDPACQVAPRTRNSVGKE